jgi:Mg2+ and Co2+ transporter CorA
VALRDPDPATFEQMQAQFDLHPLAIEDARHGHQRPKIEDYGDSLFAVLQIIEPSTEDFRIGEVAIFAGRNYVLTVRSHSERGFQDVRAREIRHAFEQRLNQAGESIRDSVATATSVNLSMITLQESENMKRLAACAVTAIDTYLFVRLRRAGWL